MTARPRALIALTSALLLAACSSGSTSGTAGSASGNGTASGSGSPSASAVDAASLSFGAERVGSFATGSPGPAVEALLRSRLGVPGKVAELAAGCGDINPQPATRRMTWGTLTVILSHEKKGLTLLGWRMEPGSLPAGVQLPHGVTTKTTVRDALRAIPGARGNWDDTFQLYEITAPRDAGMVWAGEKADGSGSVTVITNSFIPCD